MKRRRKQTPEPLVPPGVPAAERTDDSIEGVRIVPVAPQPSPDEAAAGPATTEAGDAGDDFSVTAAFGLRRVVPIDTDPLAGASPISDAVASPIGDTASTSADPVPTRRGPTLVIGGDDLPDAVELSEVVPEAATPKIDPRLRRRRIAVRRAAGRRRLVVAIVVGVVIVAVLGALVVLASPLFGVRDVEVAGAVYTSAEELDSVLAPLDGDPILTLDTDAVVAALEALPWVRRARVQTEFPSTLFVEISERVPVAAYAGGDGRWRVIDREGRVIAVIPDGAQPADYLPIEATGPDVEAGQSAGDLYRVAGELAMSLPVELHNVTTSITLTSSGEIGLRLSSQTVVSFGQPTDLRKKLTVLIELLRDNDPTSLVALDLADPDSPGITRG